MPKHVRDVSLITHFDCKSNGIQQTDRIFIFAVFLVLVAFAAYRYVIHFGQLTIDGLFVGK